ncbi:MAG: acetoacetate--CoA ligase [Gammaproteobacteria bacterium]
MIEQALWNPPEDALQNSQMGQFMAAVNAEFGLDLASYPALWQWSADDPAAFWAFWWRYSDVIASEQPSQTLRETGRFETDEWFPGARLNFDENLLRHRDERPALVFRAEDGSRESMSYAELFQQVSAVATSFSELGVGEGDRVAAIMPNRPETIVAMLATTWLGGVWSSCSPDFGVDGILERFEQIEPTLLIGIDGYTFKGKTIDVCAKVEHVWRKLEAPACVKVSWQRCGEIDGALDWDDLTESSMEPPPFAQVAFNHPLYILFSSGTTGRPKCIVHGTGGTLLQHLKEHRLHTDIRREDVLFYFTTCGWMMWNWLASGLASGCTLVLFDGNPFYPTAGALMDLAEQEGITVFGTSAKYIAALEQAGVKPVESHSLPNLRAILSTGSPLVPESFDYVYEHMKPDVQLCSISGGTDIVSCFALGSPLLPVYRGELQCRGLGMAVDVWNDQGQAVQNEPGELVCTKPFPCKPVFFWNDPDGQRYHDAYFDRFDNIWTHGDWAELTDHGGLIITGRSDAVLNPGGVRIGTAEIYRQVERVPGVVESIAVGQDWEGDVRVVLFVILQEGVELTDDLKKEIRTTLRENASPRHVPARILQVTEIPRTRSGKITELAVRNVIHGKPVTNTEALANPEALEQFANRQELES